MSTKRERVTRSLGNPIYFGELYVRPYDEGWDESLPEFASEMAAFILGAQRGAVILPPEFLKTTIGSQVIPLWLTYRYAWANRLLRGMLLSEEEGMSSRNLGVVAWHIEHNPRLRADFSDDRDRPLVYPDPDENVWREDAIIVARSGVSKDPTWQAKGLDSSGIHGRRLDWLIGDDVVTPKNAFSAAKRRQALNLWDMQITTRLVETGHAVIMGNFNHERDLVSTLAARGSYRTFRRPAIHKPGQPEEPEEDIETGECLWPSNWSKARLAQEKTDKPQRYRRIFLLDPRAERGDKLQLDWLVQIEDDATPLKDCFFILSLDPAPGGEQHDLDYFNISVLACHDNLDLISTIDVRRDTPSQIQLVATTHDYFDRVGLGVRAIGGAKVAMDRYLRGAVIAVRPDLEHKVKSVSIPGNKEQRLEALGPHAQSGWFRIRRSIMDELTSDPDDQWQELTFAEQWKDFPNGKHDDKLDGLDVGIRTFREHGHAQDVEYELVALDE